MSHFQILSGFRLIDEEQFRNATETDGKAAQACILAKKPCISVCFTDFHASELRKRLVRWVWSQFQDQSSPLYKVQVQTLMKDAKAKADADGKTEGKADGKPVPAPKQRPRP